MTVKDTMIVSVALLMASATVWGAEAKPAGALLLVSVAQLPTADAASTTKTPADNPVLAERNETPEQHDARMAWWREAKFGMFVHWGLYAQAGGEWNGKPVEGGYAEWIMFNGKIPIAEYAAAAKDFNPVRYDAEKWVLAAKNAGMKYIVITSKHHDGFAMFKSAASPLTVSIDGAPVFIVEASKISEAWGSYTSPAFAVTAGAHTLAFTVGAGEGMDLIDNVEVKTGIHKGEAPEQP